METIRVGGEVIFGSWEEEGNIRFFRGVNDKKEYVCYRPCQLGLCEALIYDDRFMPLKTGLSCP
jgi:hypothetical protein